MVEMKLKQIYFKKIESGEKIYEIRLNDEKRKLLKINDEIIFYNLENYDEKLIAKVSDLLYYSSLINIL